MSLSIHKKGIILFLFVIIFFTELIRTAWITDDAIITLRTVLNFINGYGAVFNVGERVQAYTHPLWFVLLSIVSIFIKNIFIATLLLCFVTTLLTCLILFNKISKNSLASLVAMEVLIFSKAFVDFSTSGLENPLSHLLIVIAIYFVLKLHKNYQPITVFSILLACACLYLTRPDLIIMFIPITLAFFIQYRENYRNLFRIMLLAATPIIVWTLFSLFYYGAPFPNTAYAKLGAGIEIDDRIRQGVVYFLDSLQRDPITLSFIVIGILCGVIQSAYCRLLTLGTILYLVYIVSIGGDFMSGRFFTAPLLLSIIFITLTHFHKIVYIILALFACKLGIDNIQATLFSNSDYENTVVAKTGIADERGSYFQTLGLISNNQSVIFFDVPEWRVTSAKKVIVACGLMGLSGLKGGPNLHIIDQCALTDPLLARLPAKLMSKWRIGHFYRQLPDGYVETVLQQRNMLVDPGIRKIYSYLQLITQGNLTDFSRLKAIFALNSRTLAKSNFSIYRKQVIDYLPVKIDYLEISKKPLDLSSPLESPENQFFMDSINIKLPSPKTIKSLNLALSYFNNGYRIDYLANNKIIFSTLAKPPMIVNTPMFNSNLLMTTQVPDVDTISISAASESLKSGHYMGYIKIN